MNKGNKRLSVRVQPLLRNACEAYLAARNTGHADNWTVSDMVNHALLEFLAHKARSGNTGAQVAMAHLYAMGFEIPNPVGQRE